MVSRIDIVRASNTELGAWASLGEVVTVLGPPDALGIGTDSIRSYYLDQSLTFFHSTKLKDHVDPQDNFDCLFVLADPLKTPWELSWAAWKGFTRIEYYRASIIR